LAISSSAFAEHLAERRQLLVEIHRHLHGVRERDDLNVKFVFRGENQQSRQRRATVCRFQVHEAAAHGQGSDHGQLVCLGPGQQLLGFRFVSISDVVDQSKSGQTTPLERLPLRRSKSGAVNLEVGAGPSGRSCSLAIGVRCPIAASDGAAQRKDRHVAWDDRKQDPKPQRKYNGRMRPLDQRIKVRTKASWAVSLAVPYQPGWDVRAAAFMRPALPGRALALP
jgi:hypothetical protein